MTPRLRELLDRARQRRGSFWRRRISARESFEANEGQPAAMRQALALERILANVPAFIGPGERIVGTQPCSPEPDPPPAPISLRVSQDPYRTPAERAALRAGVFTSGEKTGHLTPDYPRLLAEGFGGARRRLEAALATASGPERTELEAMAVTLRAASDFCRRHAAAAREMVDREADEARQGELRAVGAVCDQIAEGPARTLHEALQLVWFAYLIQCMEEGESTAAFALGRFDQYLCPFWEADLAAGRSRDHLLELVGCFWVKLNEFLGLQVLNLTIGGSNPDGSDSVNDLSFACLELMATMRTAVPSLSVRWHPHIDPAFFRQSLRLATMGFGQPAIYGDPAARRAMEHAGVSPDDAADVVPGGCVELGVQGCCYPWVGNFFSLAKCLELALHNGVEPRSGEQVGPETGTPEELPDFEELLHAYEQQVTYAVALMAESDNTTDHLAGENNPYPFLSALVADCIERGLDVTAGGARYNFTEVQGVGIAHVVDSLLNIRRLVYEDAEMTLADLVAATDADFTGDERLRQRLRSARPAYGDGSQEAEGLARRVVTGFFDAVDRSTNPRGGPHRPGLLVWTLYNDWADAIGALADGRRRGEALSSSIGPRPDLRVDSPTSIIHDATAFDHWRCAGALTLNLRFDARTVRGEDGLDALQSLVEGYFERGGMQVQLNVVDSDTLRLAQASPESYADLLVRVSGFVARFVDLAPRMQDEIIERTELAAADRTDGQRQETTEYTDHTEEGKGGPG